MLVNLSTNHLIFNESIRLRITHFPLISIINFAKVILAGFIWNHGSVGNDDSIDLFKPMVYMELIQQFVRCKIAIAQ